jgi:hypothetical protein
MFYMNKSTFLDAHSLRSFAKKVRQKTFLLKVNINKQKFLNI